MPQISQEIQCDFDEERRSEASPGKGPPSVTTVPLSHAGQQGFDPPFQCSGGAQVVLRAGWRFDLERQSESEAICRPVSKKGRRCSALLA
eukprot:1220947-Amphidinium_carterae.1